MNENVSYIVSSLRERYIYIYIHVYLKLVKLFVTRAKLHYYYEPGQQYVF